MRVVILICFVKRCGKQTHIGGVDSVIWTSHLTFVNFLISVRCQSNPPVSPSVSQSRSVRAYLELLFRSCYKDESRTWGNSHVWSTVRFGGRITQNVLKMLLRQEQWRQTSFRGKFEIMQKRHRSISKNPPSNCSQRFLRLWWYHACTSTISDIQVAETLERGIEGREEKE